MNNKYFDIKDNCRKGLLKHLERATETIPKLENPKILDVGCGSGVPTLYILEKFGGEITAVDFDPKSINTLREKVNKLNLIDKVNLSNCSLFDLNEDDSQFDLIIAEGLLNIVGFQEGFLKIVNLIKSKGFIIIHDEFQNQKNKIEFIENNNCEILDSFELNEEIWWHDYYKCLEKEISAISEKDFLMLFESELLEIKAFKKDSSEFKSIYYVIKRN